MSNKSKYRPSAQERLTHRPTPKRDALIVFNRECEDGDPARPPELMIIKKAALLNVLGKLYDWVILQNRKYATSKFLQTNEHQLHLLQGMGLIKQKGQSKLYWSMTPLGQRAYEFNYWYEKYRRENSDRIATELAAKRQLLFDDQGLVAGERPKSRQQLLKTHAAERGELLPADKYLRR